MERDGFFRWLLRNGNSEKTASSHLSRMARLEAALAEYNLPFSDLDEAFQADSLESVLAALRRSLRDLPIKTPPKALVPNSTEYVERITAALRCAEKYRNFRMDVADDSQADRIREHAMRRFIEPARALGESTCRIEARQIASDLEIQGRTPNVFQALTGKTFLEMARVEKPEVEGVPGSTTAVFTYRLTPSSTHSVAEAQATGVMPYPTNLVLYGPPGTGKTYKTAYEAVRLCGEEPSEDRDKLMLQYSALVAAGRIAFVTFHQSFDYESFVEGLRPETGDEDGNKEDGSVNAGFRLAPRAGIFREIARMAEEAATVTNPGIGHASGAPFEVGQRQVFKMSLGRGGSEEHIYDDSIENGTVSLGWGGGIDWKPFDNYQAIHARWNQDNPGTNGNDGNIAMTACFRASMKPSDLVLVSAGNHAIRAIGEIIGDYEFAPESEYTNRRRVRWLKVFDDPIPVNTVYERAFSMRSCYQLRNHFLKRPALQTLLSGVGDGTATAAAAAAPAAPPQFVLVIDEINRGNVSKIFGELITLIEPDKRLGMTNALTVRLPYSRTEFGVPANLHILGTMNTADRSIALLDTALRRRFIFRELAPDPALLIRASARSGINLTRILATINDRIEFLIDREHRIGHAFFMGCQTREGVDGVMRDKVIPLLQEYFFEDWSRLAAVVGDGGDKTGSGRGGFLQWRRIPCPFGSGEVRWSWSVCDVFAPGAYDRLLGKTGAVPDERAGPDADSVDGDAEEEVGAEA